jgi:ABC-2 type transport system permease protein
VRDWEVVLGKFLAALALLCAALGLTLIFAITVKLLGPLDRGPTLGGYIGLVMMGGAYVAIGLMASSFTRNQIVAFIVSFAICFCLYLFGRLTQFVPESIRGVVAFLAIDSHFENISRGVIDSRDVIYYLSVMGICLLIATTSLESRKWK